MQLIENTCFDKVLTVIRKGGVFDSSLCVTTFPGNNARADPRGFPGRMPDSLSWLESVLYSATA